MLVSISVVVSDASTYSLVSFKVGDDVGRFDGTEDGIFDGVYDGVYDGLVGN